MAIFGDEWVAMQQVAPNSGSLDQFYTKTHRNKQTLLFHTSLFSNRSVWTTELFMSPLYATKIEASRRESHPAPVGAPLRFNEVHVCRDNNMQSKPGNGGRLIRSQTPTPTCVFSHTPRHISNSEGLSEWQRCWCREEACSDHKCLRRARSC